MKLNECYRPYFDFRMDALTAKQILHNFTVEFRFLPDCSSEPERLSSILQGLLYDQRKLTLPDCPRHGHVMVMLGNLGAHYVRPTAKIKQSTIHQVGNGGKILVRCGIYRCVHPLCYCVAPTENSDTIVAWR